MTIRPPRVLMLSDVYFPRVNGRATSRSTLKTACPSAASSSALRSNGAASTTSSTSTRPLWRTASGGGLRAGSACRSSRPMTRYSRNISTITRRSSRGPCAADARALRLGAPPPRLQRVCRRRSRRSAGRPGSVIGKTLAESRIPVIQRVQFSELRLGELEIEDVQVFAPVIGPARLRQRHRADLEVPAQQDLRG